MNLTNYRIQLEAAQEYNATLHIRQDAARHAGILAYELAEENGGDVEQCNAAYWRASDAILPRAE